MKKACPAEPSRASALHPGRTPDDGRPARGRSLWLWVAAGFVFLGLLWAAMFVVARSAEIRSVPLTTSEAKP
jgi:hypothetical protein